MHQRNHVTLAAVALALPACIGATENRHTAMTDSSIPMVCTLTPEQLQSVREELLPGLLARADEVTDLENGVRLAFRSQPGLLAELAQMMDRERGCCRFLRFELRLEPDAGPVILDVTGPPGTREILRSL